MLIHEIQEALTTLRQVKPLILCLTNYVTMDFMANALLSLGAAPIMSQEIEELETLVSISHALSLNIGTLDHAFVERATAASRWATTQHKPIILDPVGAGATDIRTATAHALMSNATIVRGNASEIIALTTHDHQTLGVESTHQVHDATDNANELATRQDTVIVVSGVQDFITDGMHQKHLTVGSPMMSKVTGMGCTLTAVIAAFRAIIPDSFHAAYLATAYFGLCGNLAAEKAHHPGSFRTQFIDELHRANLDAMRRHIHVA